VDCRPALGHGCARRNQTVVARAGPGGSAWAAWGPHEYAARLSPMAVCGRVLCPRLARGLRWYPVWLPTSGAARQRALVVRDTDEPIHRWLYAQAAALRRSDQLFRRTARPHLWPACFTIVGRGRLGRSPGIGPCR